MEALKNEVTVALKPHELRMIAHGLHIWWLKMVDDDGVAITCNQESADAVYKLYKEFDELAERVKDV